MKRLCMMMIVVITFLSLNCRAFADSNAEEILKAVVKIHSIIPKGASSTATLGTEREGNGVVIDAEGTILTLGYLVRDAEKIEVLGSADEPVNATLAGYDYSTGLAILRTEKPLGLSPIKFGQSSTVKAGDPILIAGFGGGDSVQIARIISRKEFAGSWEYLLDEAIFTAPATNDFSGAALIDREGRLVGIGYLYTQVVMQGFGLLPCNMFVPIDLFTPILEDMKTVGRSMKMQRPWLGINAEEANDRIFITKVTSGGPAEKAGLKPGDMVLMVDGKEVKGLSDFYRRAWGVGNAGVTVPLTVLHGVKVIELLIQSGDRQKMLIPKPHKGVAI